MLCVERDKPRCRLPLVGINCGKLALHCRSPGHKRKAPIEPLSRIGSYFSSSVHDRMAAVLPARRPNAPTLRPDVPIWVNRRMVSRRSSLMPGDHSSRQGSDTINALSCGALIPNGADGWRHCFERAKNGQIRARSPNSLVASLIVISIERQHLVCWLQYHNHPHSLPDISNRFMVRFCFNETKI